MKSIPLSELKSIYETYLNDNISDAKEQTKKLPKEHRKLLYQQVSMKFTNENWDFCSKDALFFFNLI